MRLWLPSPVAAAVLVASRESFFLVRESFPACGSMKFDSLEDGSSCIILEVSILSTVRITIRGISIKYCLVLVFIFIYFFWFARIAY
mgnify:CR=1 FL=1